MTLGGGQLLSGRVLDLRSRDWGFEPHRRHCVVSLSKTLCPLLSTGLTQEDPSRHDWDVNNQNKHYKQINDPGLWYVIFWMCV